MCSAAARSSIALVSPNSFLTSFGFPVHPLSNIFIPGAEPITDRSPLYAGRSAKNGAESAMSITASSIALNERFAKSGRLIPSGPNVKNSGIACPIKFARISSLASR